MNRKGRFVVAVVFAASLAGMPSGNAQVPGIDENAVIAAAADPAAVARELAGAVTEIERLAEESRQLESEAQGIDPRREALIQRARHEIRMLYHLEQGQALAVRGGPESLLDHVAQLQHVRRALQLTLRELESVARRATTLRVDHARLALETQEAQERRIALETQHRQLEALGSLRLPVTTAGLAEGAAMAGGSVPVGPSITVYGGGVAATASDAQSFADAAGRLLFPVAGRAEARRAQREGTEGPGVEIAVALGSPVRAVFPGRVAFADRYGAYGRIVILEHGEHYYTVSANLASMNVRVGEEVTTGTVLGTVGDDGRGPMLYFEVRRGSETVDPAPWLGL